MPPLALEGPRTTSSGTSRFGILVGERDVEAAVDGLVRAGGERSPRPPSE